MEGEERERCSEPGGSVLPLDRRLAGVGLCVALAKDVSAEEALDRLVTSPKTSIGPLEQVRSSAEGHEFPDYATPWRPPHWVTGRSRSRSTGFRRPSMNRSPGHQRGSRLLERQRLEGVLLVGRRDPGEVLRSPLPDDDPGWLGSLLPQEDGLTFGLGRPIVAAMACMERLTGVHLTQRAVQLIWNYEITANGNAQSNPQRSNASGNRAVPLRLANDKRRGREGAGDPG